MNDIEYADIFELLAPELEQSASALRAALQKDGTGISSVVQSLESSGFDDSGMILSAPVIDHGQAIPLVAEGAKLTTRYVKALLGRQCQDVNTAIGPLKIAPTEALVAHYRSKMRRVLNAIVADVSRARSQGLRRFYGAADSSGHLKVAQECFAEVSEKLLESPECVTSLVRMVAASARRDPFGDGPDAALVAMVLFHQYLDRPGDDRGALVTIGTAALLQDISLSGENLQRATAQHAAQSAGMAATLGASPRVVGLIRQHHTMTDPQGRPALMSRGFLTPEAKVLVATNAFTDECSQSANGNPFEVAKKLSHLAAQRYVDTRAVRILCRLLLPKLKAYVLEQSDRIAAQCTRAEATPILWPILGDKVPTVFLCQDSLCQHRTEQVSHISRPVVFQVEGQEVASVSAGDYSTCSALTPHLRALHVALQGRGRG
ncbi:MAG: hypothetical protein HZB55_11755 [Deltaproteobacteria bacterium]|nr:hypothetical protein [Deltaproteobacteria bacterium]